MEVSTVVRTLLSKRGIEAEHEIAAFLHPDYEMHTHDPFLLQGMKEAVSRILRAIEREERIAVYADFDCDGIPGAALLQDFFQKVGHTNFEVYLPHRDREGYGFHPEAIAKLASREVKLIITVDVGTNAVAPVGYAKQLGVETIVTDHHEVMGALPAAVAVLNPKIGEYPFRDLCGAAVAFKLVQALLRSPSCALRGGVATSVREKFGMPEGWEKWLLDMVALATVADLVPLTGENRALAHFGLKVLRRSKRPGIDALCARMRLQKSALTEDDIGFSLAPRINAASRMDDPDLALRLLTTQDLEEADRLAGALERLNASRKGVVSSLVREAKRHMHARFAEDERVIVMGDTAWKPSLLGLAANTLMAKRGGVVCLWGRDGGGRLKGSCRSDGSVSIVELFAEAGELFEESGGHAASGGFTVSYDRVHSLPSELRSVSLRLAGARIAEKKTEADFELSLPQLSADLFADVRALSPFGVGNPKPIFFLDQTLVTRVGRFGREKNHVEILLECRRSGARARAFDFFKSPGDFSLTPAPGMEAGILATLERDTYRGGIALRLVDILPAR
ncbi:MAG: single-stranded-DNA-specific exonuclease, single-stranded-DNA-specific exonuclease [Candidatus Parcubacteria bacterium]|jgi:single-stranded-DNA-specific exonuclease